MARVKDRWYNSKKGPDGLRAKSTRYGAGDRWQVEYVDDQGQTKYPTFRTRAAAEQFASAVDTDLVRGQYIDPDKGLQPFGDYVRDDWRPGQVQHAPSTVETLTSDLKNHILPAFGGRPIGKIQRRDVVAWVAARSKVLAPRTLHRVYGYLATILKAAVADGLIKQTPCVNINLPPITRTRIEPLPALAVEALIDAAPERWRCAFVVAAGMGMREGEILGLTQDRVDVRLPRRRIRVDRQAQTPNRGSCYLRPVKREASERSIPLPNVVAQSISGHIKLFPPPPVEVDIYTERSAGAPARRAKVRLLYPGQDGTIMRRNRFIDSVWKPTVKAAEKALHARAADARATGHVLDAEAAEAAADRLTGKVDFHELRHFYASMLKIGRVASDATFGSFCDRCAAGVPVAAGLLAGV
ncbi:site-specific integrase [Pseudofrankia sp. DC12]|uniref:tyrosine-type recombinase/integrase n=1 Tax=Pseudofrankia sp. DC12 TaxID=683315 RepID=UPI000695EAB6|nr:site-specific integrase [Pseudofrankia sp. DC12]